MTSAVGAHADEVTSRLAAGGAEAVEAIRAIGDSVGASLVETAASFADLAAPRPHGRRPHRRQQRRRGRGDPGSGDSVAQQLAEAAANLSSVANAHADDVVTRITASGVGAVIALQGAGDQVSAQLSDATASVERGRRARQRDRRPAS